MEKEGRFCLCYMLATAFYVSLSPNYTVFRIQTMGDLARIDIQAVLAQKAPRVARHVPGWLINYLARIIHQEELNEILSRYRDREGVDFMRSLIDYFDLHFELVHPERIPEKGRFIFVSNHPLGGLDGICLSTLIGDRFQDQIYYLVNDLLLHIPNLRSIFVPINKHGAQSRETALQIEAAYASDRQIITFPAGLCSRQINGCVQDLEWKKSFIQKAVTYERDIVPIFFDGKNSSFFYRFARLRKALGIRMNYEMIYLPDEMFKSKQSTFRIYFGEPIPWQTFDATRTSVEWANWVRTLAYQLKQRKDYP